MFITNIKRPTEVEAQKFYCPMHTDKLVTQTKSINDWSLSDVLNEMYYQADGISVP